MKEKCKEAALDFKQRTGKFPVYDEWKARNGFPCGVGYLTKLFEGSYNNFRNYCNEPQISRTKPISLEWVKSNCTINENSCWIWEKAKRVDEYGVAQYRGRLIGVHRIVYELVHNIELVENQQILHSCNIKSCCNPEHLREGSRKENSLDAIANGRIISNNNYLRNKVVTIDKLEDRIKFYIENATREEGCLLSYFKNNRRYPVCSYKGKIYTISRLIIAYKEGKDYNDNTWQARHLCNNSRCIDPEHLESGSRSDNILDSRKFSKNTKLNINNVLEVKTALLTNELKVTVFDEFYGKKFKVSKTTIKDIRRGVTWKDVKMAK